MNRPNLNEFGRDNAMKPEINSTTRGTLKAWTEARVKKVIGGSNFDLVNVDLEEPVVDKDDVIVFKTKLVFKPHYLHPSWNGPGAFDVAELASKLNHFSQAEEETGRLEDSDVLDIAGHRWLLGDGDDSLGVQLLRASRDKMVFQLWIRWFA